MSDEITVTTIKKPVTITTEELRAAAESSTNLADERMRRARAAMDGRPDLLQHMRNRGLTVQGSTDGSLALVFAPGAWNGRHVWAQYYPDFGYWMVSRPDSSRLRTASGEVWIGVEETKVETIGDAQPVIGWLLGVAR